MIETKLSRIEVISLASGLFPTTLHAGGHEFLRIAMTEGGSWYLRLVADGSIWTTNEFGGLVPIGDPRRGTQDGS